MCCRRRRWVGGCEAKQRRGQIERVNDALTKSCGGHFALLMRCLYWFDDKFVVAEHFGLRSFLVRTEL